MVMTRGVKARDESQAPSVSAVPQGAIALARPSGSVDQSMDGSRPSLGEAAPSLLDMPSISDVPDP